MTFLELNSDYKYSKDVDEKGNIAIYLKPFESYRQYIPIDLKIGTTGVSIELLANGNVVEGLAYEFEVVNGYLILDFLLIKDFKSDCLRLRINSEATNPFSCSYYDLDKTTLVSYWHSEEIYGIPNEKPSQIRLPLYYKGVSTSENSEEYITNFRVEENVARSRVKRVFKSVWLVDGNDWVNKRLAKVSDLDFVYLDTVRHITDPFTFDEAAENIFSLSEWETQEREGDVIEIGLTGAITVQSKIIDVYYNNQTPPYCLTDFFTGYYHTLGISQEFTIVHLLDIDDNVIQSITYEDLMNCALEIDLEGRTDNFAHAYRFYLTDLAGNRSNSTQLTVRFYYEGTRYYDEQYYNSNYYA